MSRRDLRAEDVLAVVSAIALLAVAGAKSVGRIHLTENNYWDFAFILFPLALLVFREAVVYAFRPVAASKSGVRVGGRTAAIVRDWMPFSLFLLIYEAFQVNLWSLVSPVAGDAFLLHCDVDLFGGTPAVYLERFITPTLTGLLTIAYALHLVLPPLLALVLYRSDLRTFRTFLFAILLCAIIGSFGYLTVPAVGPGIAFPKLFNRTLTGQMYLDITGLIDVARAPRDAFPSLHVAVSSVVLYFSWRKSPGWFYAMLPLVLANWLSTLYLRYHYLVDVFAGWATAIFAIALALWFLQLEQKWKGPEKMPDRTV